MNADGSQRRWQTHHLSVPGKPRIEIEILGALGPEELFESSDRDSGITADKNPARRWDSAFSSKNHLRY